MKKTNFKNFKIYQYPFIIAISVFSLSMVILWFDRIGEFNKMITFIGIAYSLICFVFLLFQIYAFFKAHTDYDETLEEVKYKVFAAEKDEWGVKEL